MAGVPRRAADVLSPAWLTAALGTRFPGIEVTAVEPGPVVSRLSTNLRFRITCAGGVPDGLSADLCAKGYFGEAGWPLRRAGLREARFYRDLAAATGIRTLRGVYADVDDATGANVVITEDVIAQGGVFLDGREPYGPDQAAESLTQLAVLHASTWADPALAGAGWLRSRLDTHLAARGLPEIRRNFDGPLGTGVPAEVRDPARLVDAYRALAARARTAPVWSVVHGDAHIGNLFLDAAGRPSFADWQVVQRGPWYLDVGYHLASALTVADRRRHEDDLLRHYLEVLGDRLAGRPAGAAEPPSWDEARRDVRLGIVHGLYLWAITLLVDPAVIAVRLERLGTAAADHDALSALVGPANP